MYAIASLLDPVADKVVQGLWEQFESRCGLRGIKNTPLPHFSWLGAEGYQIEPVELALAELANKQRPFVVQAAGLGVFTGPLPVIYIALVKNTQLLHIHEALWEQVRNYAVTPNRYYDPDRWMPHITIALREMQPEGLGCAVADVAFRRIEFEIQVDHFAIIYQTDGKAGLKSRFSFGTDSQSPKARLMENR